MNRIALTDGPGWFDRDKATCYEEGTRFNGSNHISLATGSQWEHEELHHTKSGSWILCSWSDWQGSGAPTYERISEQDAADWLIRNKRTLPSGLQALAAGREV